MNVAFVYERLLLHLGFLGRWWAGRSIDFIEEQPGMASRIR